MTTSLLVALIFILTVFDAKFTTRRINEYGLVVETNKGIHRMSKWLGTEAGVLIMIFGPTLFWTFLCVKMGWTAGLGFLAGFKLRFWFNQIESLHFEKEAKVIAKFINSRAASVHPSHADESQDSPSQRGPKD